MALLNVPKRLTKQQIEDAQAKHRTKVVQIEYPVGDETLVVSEKKEVATFFVVKPSRAVLDLIAKTSQEGKNEKCNQILLKNCVLAGDTEYIEETSEKCDDDIYYGLLHFCSSLVSKKQGLVKN